MRAGHNGPARPLLTARLDANDLAVAHDDALDRRGDAQFAAVVGQAAHQGGGERAGAAPGPPAANGVIEGGHAGVVARPQVRRRVADFGANEGQRAAQIVRLEGLAQELAVGAEGLLGGVGGLAAPQQGQQGLERPTTHLAGHPLRGARRQPCQQRLVDAAPLPHKLAVAVGVGGREGGNFLAGAVYVAPEA